MSIKPILIWTAILLLPLAIVGGMERRIQALDAELDATVHRYERWMDNVIQDAAALERDVEVYRMELARRSYQADMGTQEFLSVMADYLSGDGRCEVIIKETDWSTWSSENY